jgi:hypothetical protein
VEDETRFSIRLGLQNPARIKSAGWLLLSMECLSKE